MAREAEQLARQPDRLADLGVGGIEPGLADVLVGDLAVALAPDQAGEARGHVLLEAQGLADLADRHARAVVDDGRADGGALAAVAGIEILDHLLAPLVLEVDVDVGRLAAVGRDEALEQQVDLGRIDAGDAEAEAHRAVGGRAAALAEDVLLAGEAHDVVDGEEVARVVEPRDQRQLLDEERAHLVGDAVGIVPGGVLPGQLLQIGLRGLARRHRLVGILVAQLLEVEGDALGDLERAGDGLRDSRANRRAISAPLFRCRSALASQAVAGFGDRALLADAGEHVGERLAVGMVIEHVVGGDERRARLAGELVELAQAPALVAVVGEGGAEIDAAARGGGQRARGARRNAGVSCRGGRAMKIWPSLAAIISSKEKWHWPLMARRLPAVSRRHSRP